MNKDLLAIILPLMIQYTPTAVKDIVDLIHGNPQKQDESDPDYLARIGKKIDDGVTNIDSQDAEIQK